MNTAPASPSAEPEDKPRRPGCLQVVGILVLVILVTAGATFWAVKSYLDPSDFKPVRLNAEEERTLNEKLTRIGFFGARLPAGEKTREPSSPTESAPPLEPEPYSEEGAERSVSFSEKELNAMLAKNTALAQKLAIDLSDNLVSAKLLVPLEEDFPVLGGKTLRVNAGMALAYDNDKPIVILKGISIMGVPLPNAWLGGIKNIDLVKEFGAEEGFWKSFAAGVKNIRVEEAKLRLELKE
ncbi:MAG: arginine N-succinyltransferase [Gammaproteobacteria bacterium]